MFYVWLTIVIVLAIVEMVTVALVSIWFVLSGILAMISTFFTDNITIQIAIFVIFGLVFMLLTRKIVNKIVPIKVKTNIDRIIGMEGIVTKEITKNNPGEVKVDGKVWAAVANKKIPVNSPVKILEINSTKLTVERMEDWYYGDFYCYYYYLIGNYYSKC